MARIRSVDFLPEIFQTDANKQFLAATLDQLIQEPKFKKTQGFIGRTVGPGVNPNDKYVIEPNKVRADYQLEPGVVSLTPNNTSQIQDAITYPGINDALAFQGAVTSKPDELYTSEYYSWDPFVNFDTFVNFGQYYWIPQGPAPVEVFSGGVPYSDNFAVTRADGVYTFSGITGNNPIINLVRGGSYNFQVAQNQVETVNFRVNHNGVASYSIDYQPNPVLTLARGNTYVFSLTQVAEFPFWIKTAPTTGAGDAYSTGVDRNGANVGKITFTVPQNAPDTLYYSCQTQALMNGQINIIDGTPGSGSKFWIQTQPGVSGTNPATPNISTRDVLGVINNGTDLGTVTFNVPSKNAQDFYYSLTPVAPVDLVTPLRFDQVNYARLDQFIETYGGIDGIKNLQGRTLVFSTQQVDQTEGGWIDYFPGWDPLERDNALNGLQGSWDTGPWSIETPVPPEKYFSVWQISYYESGGYTYMLLNSIRQINELEKFSILYGTEYSSTQWYKDQNDLFQQIPLLSAEQDILYYQDSTDPEIFGQIRLIDQTNDSTLYIDEILGKKNYTSPNGVAFTNGLKVKFPGSVIPASYSTNTYTVQCVSTAAGINLITVAENYTTDGLRKGQTVTFSGTAFGGISDNTTYYIREVFTNSQFSVSTTPNGPAVTLTSAFGTMIAIASQAPEYYVSGVGTAIELLLTTDFITPESVFNENTETSTIDYLTINRASKDLNAWSRSNRWFHIDVLNATGEYNNTPVVLDNAYRAKRPILEFRAGIRLFDMGTKGKQPVNLVDFDETDALSNVEGSTGYTAYSAPVTSLNLNIGTQYEIVSVGSTNWNTVAGTLAQSYSAGDIITVVAEAPGTGTARTFYTVVDGDRVIFAADEDLNVRNKIYVVNFILPNTSPTVTAGDFEIGGHYQIATLGSTDWNAAAGTTGVTYAVGDEFTAQTAGTGTGTALFLQPIIHLELPDDGDVLNDESVTVITGPETGYTFWYNGSIWAQAQLKTSVQQAPLFNIFDSNGISFSDTTTYPSSSFTGSKLFSYALGSGVSDAVLKFPLKYLTLSNVGDIVFDNNFYADTFVYVTNNNSTTLDISNGYVYEYADRTAYTRLLGWQTAVVPTIMRQQFKFIYNSAPLQLDVKVLPDNVTVVPSVKVFVGSKFQDPGTYTVQTTDYTTQITFSTVHAPGDVIEVEVISDQQSQTAFYQVPLNLEKNPLNNNSDFFTLGTVRQHYESICQNLTTLTGPINGANNTRDLGNIIPYGQVILQQSSPLTLAGYFMRSKKYNIFGAIEYNSREYQKYKNQLLEAVTRQTISLETAGQVLDTVIADITLGRTDENPFYWSDMLPASQVYTTTNYTISNTTNDTFDTLQVYNYESANYLGMNVYLNGEILTRDLEYRVATDGPRIVILEPFYSTLVNGDVVTIQEYSATYGTFCPNTPTKLGLYPAWRPEILTVKSSSGTQQVIQGHDGSQTPLFNDIRDEILLEFETRIYNNLKVDGNPVPLTIYDVVPGQFRETGYSFAEINSILAVNLLTYVGWNKLPYNFQNYNNANAFTYNYSTTQNKLNANQNLLGAWRGINRYFYDTQQPELTPWEMLGFLIKPDWWDVTYGAGPYTNTNMNLWDDLEAGIVRDPAGAYVKPEFVRPGLTSVIPTDSEGNLLPPLDSVAGIYNNSSFQKSWVPGDGGPVEASWWNSSDYPFAVMRLLALTRPAKFFALFADRDLYRYNEEFGQYLYNNRYRLDANNIVVYGDGVSKASYIDWIVDYNKVLGENSTKAIEDDLSNLDVRLCYRMASFSDKQYIKLYTEKSSPNSINTTLLIPDESYDLLLYKNQPFDRNIYSSVVIQVVEGGWAVYGYSTTRPYFNILSSQPIGVLRTFTSGGKTIRVPTNYTQNVVQVPYGFVFTTESSVADFLLSYGQLLIQQGFTFDNQTNGYIMDWGQMVQEFLYWSAQGWGVGNLINLNPLAEKLTVTKEKAIVDTIEAQTVEHVLLNQNRADFAVRDLNIIRQDNTFSVQPLTTDSLSFIDMRYTSYESMIVLNNASLFGDLIYEPTTGARQSRLFMIAVTTTEWNGSVDAQGFILNQNNISEWTGLKTYAKGELVKYKNSYWSAATIVQPSAKFNYSDWNQSDYTLIQQGLLPNIANKANQLANSYDINQANLEVDNDLLSYGLIGYRPRQYLAALNLDDVSQLNVYREFIGTKGTKGSLDLLGRADLGKEVANYTTYENWAVQRSVYGANANRSFFDIRLNRAYLNSNPSVVQIVSATGDSTADQQVLLSDLWKTSFAPTTPDILPTTASTPTDISLPSAGYVNLDDVDITVFELTNPASLSANINKIKTGTSIWVAKVNDYDWNIYRAQAVPGTIQHVCDNLDGTSRVIFSKEHGLKVGAQLIIRFFDVEVDGVYKVLSVPDINTVNIPFSFEGGRVVVDGTGIGFTLKTMRVAQASDVLTLPYTNQILPGAQVWVDNNGNDLWEVLEKQNPFTDRTVVRPLLLDASEQFGASVAQTNNRSALFVGSPRYGFNAGTTRGAVYVYVRGDSAQYVPISPLQDQDGILTLSTTGVRGYGNAIDAGSQTWAAAGASASLGPAPAGSPVNNGYVAVLYRNPTLGAVNTNPWQQWQLLTLPGTTTTTTPGAGEFGYSLAMSADERWLYVGAPGLNNVYAYGQVQNQSQSLTYLADGVSTTASIGSVIQINNANQLTVTKNGALLALTTDYTVNGSFNTVTFTTAPAAGDKIVISRKTAFGYTATGGSTYALSTYLFTVDNIYSFSITVDNVLQRPGIDYTYSAGNVIFYNVPTASSSISIVAESYYELVTTLTVAGLGASDRFGHSVSCSTDGRQVIVGCKNATVDSDLEAGKVFVFDRNVQKFIRQDDSSNIYPVLGSVTEPVSVLINNVFLTNQTSGIVGATGTFSVAGSNITIVQDLNVGDIIEIETNQFVLQQTIAQENGAAYYNFGQALDLCPYNCSLYVSAPLDSSIVFRGGSVQRSVNQARTYGTITAVVANPSLTVGDTLRVNNVDCPVPAATSTKTSLQGLADNINFYSTNVTASVTNGYLTISVLNTDAAPVGNKLQVAPGSVIGTTGAFAALGFETFVYTQQIESPYPTDYAYFGSALAINDTAETLVVSAPQGSLYLPNTFDYNTTTKEPGTTFDGNTTTFFSPVVQSGAVYTFDYLPSAGTSVANPGKFVFGQQVETDQVSPYDQYGTAVSYNSGILVATAPGNDYDDSTAAYGAAFVFENPTLTPAWTPIYTQQPTVDVRLLTSVYMYDRVSGAKSEFFDFFNPLQGKILGAAAQNLDYIGGVDPASYNVGSVNNRGSTWGVDHVGEMWWDISTVRFIDPNQDNLTYASRRWGQVFPGSIVDVYQWISSNVPPANYVGPGTVLNTTSYTVQSRLNQDGTFTTEYYFWVKGVVDTYSPQAKTLSAATVASYIQDPKSSGIAYIAPLTASAFAIYNGLEYINAADTIISIEFDRTASNANVHAEYELIAQGRPDAFLSDNLYRKLLDSFCGQDTFGNLVPDPNLNIAQRYGIQYRPRQSMFPDRFLALKNYINRVNSVLKLYPISESRSFTLLNSEEPIPPAIDGATVNWNLEVVNLEILSFQNIYAVPVGYKYLVLSDADNRGLWTIYTVITAPGNPAIRQLLLSRVQNYSTKQYWNYINWYLPGYNSTTKVVAEVPNYASLVTLNVPVGSSVKVTANAQGKFEIYLRTDLGWERVGLQDGTIAISNVLYDYGLGRYGWDVEVWDAQYWDQEPVVETRKVLEAINQDLLIGDLLVERNKALTLMFDFILSELQAPEWLIKTSLIDVDHRIRGLLPFQNYVRDNQEFVVDYIQEVKPYHVQVREFNLRYDGLDGYTGDLTDFDLPAYYNTSLPLPQYTSPILLPYAQSTYQPFNILSNTPATSTLWQQWPYSQWYQNYLLSVDSIVIDSGGSGYTVAPTVIIVPGDGDTTGNGAEAIANLNSLGQVVSVTVTNSGQDYSQTPTIVFDGGNGVSARAHAICSNGLVRSFRTIIKYDRYQYNTSVLTWSPDGTYDNGTLVRYANSVWQANSVDGSSAVIGPTFNLEDWVPVAASSLSGVNRSMGFYVPGVNQPGLELGLMISGVSYPGVQVWGDYFLGSAAETVTLTCTATSSLTNQITCNETLRLTLQEPIIFYGSTFGGINAGQTYYVSEIVTDTEFKISSVVNGSPLTLTTATGIMVADVSEPLDAIYASSFDDQYLGLRPTDVNVDGGEFIGPYEGHAPEELVNGAEFDTLDLRVYTRPGSDWTFDGHSFQIGTVTYTYDTGIANSYSWAQVVDHPFEIMVTDLTSGLDLTPGINYTVDYDDQTVSIVDGVSDGDIFQIYVYEIGGGSQLFRGNYIGTAVGDSVVIPVNTAEIYNIPVFVNGVVTTGVTWSPYIDSVPWSLFDSYERNTLVLDSGIYYRSLQTVPVGILLSDPLYWTVYVPTQFTKVDFGTTYGVNDGIALVALGVTTPVQYSWSTPQTQYVVADSLVVTSRQIVLTNSMQGTNPANLIVTKNGTRLRPPEGIAWTGDGTSSSFGLPQRGGYSQSLIQPYTDVSVWVDNVLQEQSFGAFVGSYFVTDWDGSNTPGRQVVFYTPPADGAKILISVSTVADYQLSIGTLNSIQFSTTLLIGDKFAITSWNDTAQQNLRTLVFQGPVNSGTITANEPFDSTNFDDGTVNNAPGSFDYTLGIVVTANDFDLGESGISANRLWVTLNGFRLSEGRDYTVEGQYLMLAGGTINSADVLAVTELSQSQVPEALAFRIFQDMRGVQQTYRITAATTTALAADVTATADIIYVDDAAALSEPNLESGFFGVVTIDGERIMYRQRDTVNNLISGLYRGTGGTAAASHSENTLVYDLGLGNLMQSQYQDYVVSDTSVGNGSTTTFSAPSITPGAFSDSTLVYEESVEVYVGGLRSRVGVVAGSFVVGQTYTIAAIGTTNWHAVGVPSDVYPAPGLVFTATAVGSGSGVVSNTLAQNYYRFTADNPVTIQFITSADLPAPGDGQEVTIQQRRGVTWYQQGVSTASDGRPLQETDTDAARFLRGI